MHAMWHTLQQQQLKLQQQACAPPASAPAPAPAGPDPGADLHVGFQNLKDALEQLNEVRVCACVCGGNRQAGSLGLLNALADGGWRVSQLPQVYCTRMYVLHMPDCTARVWLYCT